jgi:hypothetical protein
MPYAGARALRDDDYEAQVPTGRTLRLVDGSIAVPAAGERRTVKITGQPVPARRRPSRTATRIQSRPDRIALWAFLLGLFLVFMAVATANAATF